MNILLLGDVLPDQYLKSSIDTDVSLLLLNLEAPIIKEEPLGQGRIFRTQMRVKDDNKTGLIAYLTNDEEGSSEELDEGKPQVRFCGAHSNLKAKTVAGGAL